MYVISVGVYALLSLLSWQRLFLLGLVRIVRSQLQIQFDGYIIVKGLQFKFRLFISSIWYYSSFYQSCTLFFSPALELFFFYLILELFLCVQLIFIRGDICARGYWNITDDSSKEILLGWFEKKIENAGLYDLKDTLYFPQDAGNDNDNFL